MARDAALIERRVCPTLRFYRWARPTLSLGYFQAAADLPLEALREQGIDIVRRATGGKAILHDKELTYSLCAPESGALAGGPARSMQAIHEALAEVLGTQARAPVELRDAQTLHSDRAGSAWCFEDSSPLDLVLDRRKLVGSAARRKKGWVLFHGSLVIEAPAQTPNIGALGQSPDCDALCRALEQRLDLQFLPGTWSNEEIDDANRRAHSFISETRVYRR